MRVHKCVFIGIGIFPPIFGSAGRERARDGWAGGTSGIAPDEARARATSSRLPWQRAVISLRRWTRRTRALPSKTRGGDGREEQKKRVKAADGLYLKPGLDPIQRRVYARRPPDGQRSKMSNPTRGRFGLAASRNGPFRSLMLCARQRTCTVYYSLPSIIIAVCKSVLVFSAAYFTSVRKVGMKILFETNFISARSRDNFVRYRFISGLPAPAAHGSTADKRHAVCSQRNGS